MAKVREIYTCSACGAQTPQWLGQCPKCHEWNTLELVRTQNSVVQANNSSGVRNRPQILKDIAQDSLRPYPSGLQALDRILGNGLVPGAAILIAGEPGVGKSTLLLQIVGMVAAAGRTAIYASGEEALPQIKDRAERLGVLHPSLLAIATSQVEDILDAIQETKPALLIADSVQTFGSLNAEGLPGNVTQVRAVTTILIEACRNAGTTLILVGHVTKDGVIAGPRLLEHMVDTVISLEGDRRQIFRLLRVYKNRFGPNEELLVFRMGRNGMEIIDDPSTFFLGSRDASLSGTALVMAVEGQRPLAVETQALVARTFLSIPRRVALGIDANRLNLLLAVLEKRLKVNFGQVDIYAKIGAGMKLQDPGLDLALIAAVLSSYYDLPLPEKSIFWGEVDLNGQIRPVAGQNLRLSHAQRLAFSPIIHPDPDLNGIATVADLHARLFHRKTSK